MGFLSAITGSTPKIPASPIDFSPTPAPGLISLRVLILILLPLLSVAGTFGTWILAGSNGTVAAIEALAKQEAPFLPGSTDVILRTYTNIEAVDRQLTLLVTFFAPVVDPKNGPLFLFSTFGLGQFGAAWTLMMMEGMRQGNQRRIVSFVGIVGFIFQNITFTVTVPLWLFLHILTSPVAKPFPGNHASNVLLISTLDLKILPLTIILGYIIPSVLMAIPSPSKISPIEHQQYIALWQPFPVWCVIIQTSIRYIYIKLAGGGPNTDGPQRALGTTYLSSAKYVYTFIITLCIVTHLPVLLIALLPPSVFPTTLPLLQSQAVHSFSSVYLPYSPTFAHQVPSFTAGVHTFLQWDLYIGGTAMLLWGILLNRNAKSEKLVLDPKTTLPSYKGLEAGKRRTVWRRLFGKIAIWTLFAGPSGALTALLWERDAIVKQKTKQGI